MVRLVRHNKILYSRETTMAYKDAYSGVKICSVIYTNPHPPIYLIICNHCITVCEKTER